MNPADVLEHVREFRANGGFYDDDAVAYVSERLGVEPTRELGTACYRAKGILRDEESQAKLDTYLTEGFSLARDTRLEAGKRYEYAHGTVYVGQSVPQFSGIVQCRSIVGSNGRIAFLPGRNRTNGFYPSDVDLVREIES